MSSGLRVLIAMAILAVLVGLVAVGMWQLEAHGVSGSLVIGVAFIVIGLVLTALGMTLTEDYIRRQEWEPGKDHLRQVLKRGWYLILLGAMFIGLHYLDHLMLAARQ
jgi:O-antigen/teichoic acid export membrane protein